MTFLHKLHRRVFSRSKNVLKKRQMLFIASHAAGGTPGGAAARGDGGSTCGYSCPDSSVLSSNDNFLQHTFCPRSRARFEGRDPARYPALLLSSSAGEERRRQGVVDTGEKLYEFCSVAPAGGGSTPGAWDHRIRHSPEYQCTSDDITNFYRDEG